jgi:replicative DNA helicase
MNSDAMTEAARILTADDFLSITIHATIYKSCLNVYERGEGVDIVTLYTKTIRELNMKQLTEMQGQVPSVCHV